MSAQDVVLIPAQARGARKGTMEFVAQAFVGTVPVVLREVRARWQIAKMMELDDGALADFGLGRGEIALALKQPITQSASKILDAKRAARARD